MLSLTVTLTAAPNDAVRLLIAELEDTLSAEYPPERRHGLPLEAIFQPHVRFFVANVDDAPAGCGQGVARAILDRIEAETRAANLPVLRLKTGDRQADGVQRSALAHRGPVRPRFFGRIAKSNSIPRFLEHTCPCRCRQDGTANNGLLRSVLLRHTSHTLAHLIVADREVSHLQAG